MSQELEIRGKFKNREDLNSFLNKLSSIIRLSQYRNRFSVLFTTGNKMGMDLQIRSFNGQPEVILKSGKHTGVLRQESKLLIPKDSFVQAVSFFYALGFKRGVIAEAEDWVFNLSENLELKVTNCDKKIFCWEIEAGSSAITEEDLQNEAEKLGLTVMKEEEIKKYWKWMKKYANRKFNMDLLEDWYNKYLEKL